jgi:hypothetical protein
MDDMFPYNAGVMLMNMWKLRATYKQFLSFILNNKDGMYFNNFGPGMTALHNITCPIYARLVLGLPLTCGISTTAPACDMQVTKALTTPSTRMTSGQPSCQSCSMPSPTSACKRDPTSCNSMAPSPSTT